VNSRGGGHSLTNEPPSEEQNATQTDSIVIEERIVIREQPVQTEQPAEEKRPKKAKEKAKNRAKGSYDALQRDLVARLYHLQSEAQQLCETYLANLDSDITTLTDFLDGSSEVHKSKDAKAKTLEAWDRILDRVKLKPAKGRRKDLRKIDRAIKAMMESAFE
jgi:hypothetical protein